MNKENIIYALNADKNNLNKQLNILKNEFKKNKYLKNKSNQN